MRLQTTLILLLAMFWMVACDENGTPETLDESGTATMQIALTDAPASYDAVLVEVIGLEYQLEEQDDDDTEEEEDSEWISIAIEPTVYNLLELNNGTEAILADMDFPTGELENIRVILGDHNQLVVSGDTVDLTVPSGSTSGLKIKVDAEIENGASYKLVLDFDAAQSIVQAGKTDKYLLKPVIRASLQEVEVNVLGGVSGIIFPDTVATVVYVIDGEDSFSTYPEANGYFLFELLEAGTYSVVAVPDTASTFQTSTWEDVIVESGVITQLDTLYLAQ